MSKLKATLRILAAQPADLPVALAWLEAAGLPVDDLTPAHMRRFLLAKRGETPVGMIGIETTDGIGLLRSLVIEPEERSAGVGAALVAALEAKARDDGVRELWLLTIDANRYFERVGFSAVGRDEAPESIRNSAEFSELCPGDAVLMKKSL